MEAQVLFVDDEPNVLEGMKRAFRKEPYRIHTATSAAQALELLQGLETAVVITDHKMPSMEGTEFLSIVKRRFPDTIRVMLTGEGSLETAIKAVNEGEIYRFFTKPCNEIELAIAIRQALQHRALVSKARLMLDTLRMQSPYLDQLERENPGITKVARDDRGAVIVSGSLNNIDELLRQMEDELEKTEKRRQESQSGGKV